MKPVSESMIIMKKKLFNLLACYLVIIFSRSVVNAQINEPVQDKATLRELEVVANRISSWKTTGIVIEEVSQHFKNRMIKIDKQIDEDMKRKTGHFQNPKVVTKVVHSYDMAKLFFSSLKNSDLLYAEQDLTSGIPVSIPSPSKQTLNSIMKTGFCNVNRDGKSYDVNGGQDRKTLFELPTPRYVPGASISFHLLDLNVTASDAISNLGFKFAGEKQDSKFGKLLIYQGENARTGAKITFHVAPQYDYRITFCTEEPLDGSSMWEQSIVSLSQLGSFWLPDEAVEKSFADEDGKFVLDSTKTYKFIHKSVNDVDEDLMDVKLSTGDIERNLDTNKVNVISAKGKKIEIDTTSKYAKNVMGWGWLYMLSVSTLLIGTVGAYVKWKRNQLSKQ